MTTTTKKPADTAMSAPTKASSSPTAPRKDSTTGKVIALLERKEGATLDEMTKATGWQSHSVRAALTGLKKKKGYVIAKSKRDDVTCYSIQARS